MLSTDPGAEQGSDVCLADYCELLHCEAVAHQQGQRHARGRQDAHAPCRQSHMQGLQEDCRQLAARCFPAFSGPAAVALHGEQGGQYAGNLCIPLGGCAEAAPWCAGYFLDAFCAAHTCNKGKAGQYELIQQVRGGASSCLCLQHYDAATAGLLDALPCLQLARPARRHWGFRVLVGITLVLLCMFYAALWLFCQQHGCAPACLVWRPSQPAEWRGNACVLHAGRRSREGM